MSLEHEEGHLYGALLSFWSLTAHFHISFNDMKNKWPRYSPCFVFHERKIVIGVWNDMRVSK